MAWKDCCVGRRDIGGLNLLDLEEALHALLLKWIVKALEPGCFNLLLLLRYIILKICLGEKAKWKQSLSWILNFDFHTPTCFRIWDCIIKAW